MAISQSGLYRDAESGGAMGEGAIATVQRSAPSRRAFIKGVIASGAAASAAGYLFRGPGISSAHAQAAGTVERLVTLNVNGASRRVDVLPQETLSHTIRYKLGLTGTKLGCDHGECGACTVIIDGTTVYSCTTLTHSVRGRKITTIEGIEGPERQAAQGAGGVRRGTRTAMRLLYQRPGDGRCRAAGSQSAPDRGRGAPRDVRQSLSVRRVRSLPQRRHAGGEGGVTWQTN